MLVRTINGLPALVARYDHEGPKLAPLVVITSDLDRAGKIDALHSVLASRKLKAIREHP